MVQHNEMSAQELIELMDAHYTRRNIMDATDMMGQHANLHEQIKAFDRLLQHSISRFSAKKMYEMLVLAEQLFPDISENKKQYEQVIPSIGALRKLYTKLEKALSNKGLSERKTFLMKYLESFFDDLEFLKDLKRNFDEKIYSSLYAYFFDPLVDLDGVSFDGNKKLGDTTQNVTMKRMGTYQETENIDLKKPTDKQVLGHAIKEMYFMNEKWDLLYKDGAASMDVFDPDSYHDLVQYPNYSHFAYVLRVIPDIFTKAYKSLEITKKWWTQANKVYSALPGKIFKNGYCDLSIEQLTAEFEAKIQKLEEKIIGDENLLKTKLGDLETLKRRESRCMELQNMTDHLENMKNQADDHYVAIFDKRDAIERRHKSRNHKKKGEEVHLRELGQQLMQAESRLKMISYQCDLTTEDFQVEMEIKPEIIRFICTLELTISQLQTELEERRVEKHGASKRLALIKTNCEKMREIMQKYKDRPESKVHAKPTALNNKQHGVKPKCRTTTKTTPEKTRKRSNTQNKH